MQSDFSESDTTFHLLIKKLVPSINTNINKNDFFITGLRNVLIQPFVVVSNKPNNIHNTTTYQKHKSLHNYIRCDICFVPVEKREEIFALFTTIQKHYMSFLKFYNICKFKLLSKNTYKQYDLFFNDLDDCPPNLKITLYEQTRLYTFKIYDILNIIKSSLINYEELFLIPTLPKNPYTNLAFSYKNLYNIFYHCMFNHISIPKVFRYFFESDFNLNTFIYNYEPIVRDSIITNYYKNMSFNNKYDTILTIVHYYRNNIPITIHDQYPQKNVITFLDCSILPYLKSQYSLNPAVKDFNKIKVCTILQTLYKQNRNFGRVSFNIKTGTFVPLDEPFVFVDPSVSPFNFNSTNTHNTQDSNNNTPVNNDIFVFGNNYSNPHQNDYASDDMDIDTDTDTDNENTTLAINIPPEDVTTNSLIVTSLINTLVDTSYNRPPFTSPIFNPIVRQRNLNTITDISMNVNDTIELNNARIRLREMLAGEDWFVD